MSDPVREATSLIQRYTVGEPVPWDEVCKAAGFLEAALADRDRTIATLRERLQHLNDGYDDKIKALEVAEAELEDMRVGRDTFEQVSRHHAQKCRATEAELERVRQNLDRGGLLQQELHEKYCNVSRNYRDAEREIDEARQQVATLREALERIDRYTNYGKPLDGYATCKRIARAALAATEDGAE